MKLKAIVLSCLIACAVQVHGKEDPIDMAMKVAIEQDGSTEGQVEALKRAQVNWEDRLNSAYQLLKESMQAEEFDFLQQAQLAWFVYREKQIVLLESACSKICPGTQWVPHYEWEVMSLIKARAIELEFLVSLVKERTEH